MDRERRLEREHLQQLEEEKSLAAAAVQLEEYHLNLAMEAMHDDERAAREENEERRRQQPLPLSADEKAIPINQATEAMTGSNFNPELSQLNQDFYPRID